MSEVWLCLKKSLPCKPDSSEVHDPKANKHHRRKNNKDKNDFSNVKDCTKSQANSIMLNPVCVTHEIVIDRKSGEIKICPCYPCSQSIEDGKGVEGSSNRSMPSTKTYCVDCECGIFSKPKVKVVKDSRNGNFPTITCPREFGEKSNSLDTIEEEHDISEHSVIKLQRQESSWQIIKKICEASNVNGERKAIEIECVLKVQNTQETFACFEDCREMIKINVEKLQINHLRCLVDGNEMLRFHGTTIACSLGVNDFSTLCTLDHCGLCQILRHGFTAKEGFKDNIGVFTTSTCEKAINSISFTNKPPPMRKCVMVCRVIAGRINNPLQEIQEMNDSRYDSLVKKISCQSDIEELIVLNPRAVLPCVVVIYGF
ncbi:uncharacterized protein [Cicer arietinum]|uniref:Uncharacterized protein LOC101508696 n=1 Tax=Cicer arietinum TaxID=3827 RepID=A0A3Q7YGH6_CICAR|nr:uncharacterized protein LOC101508696 [Cicer arietinum]